jgi:cytosine/adenosine deaminase-related metal-dependent hydrolase
MTLDRQSEIAEVTGFWHGLGLPGLIDLHVHFMPQNVLSKVWAYFDAGREAGRPWPVEYKLAAARVRGSPVRGAFLPA